MAITNKKIRVVGAGFTVATTELMLAQKELGDVLKQCLLGEGN